MLYALYVLIKVLKLYLSLVGIFINERKTKEWKTKKRTQKGKTKRMFSRKKALHLSYCRKKRDSVLSGDVSTKVMVFFRPSTLLKGQKRAVILSG